MVILGIDPGSRKAGFACIKVEGKSVTYISSGVMRYDKIGEFNLRLGEIFESCNHLVEKFRPAEIALESLVYVKNPSSLMKLAQARGAMMAAFVRSHRGRVFEYSPNLVKSSVSGFGHASKEAVQKSLEMVFGKINYKYNDESDALAVAFCHSLNSRNRYKAVGEI